MDSLYKSENNTAYKFDSLGIIHYFNSDKS